MRNSWQINITFLVLLFTSCFGGPVLPPKKNGTLLINDVTAQVIKLTSDTPKVEEENSNPAELDANKVVLHPSILNINVNYQNSTAAATKEVTGPAVASENNAPAMPAVINPSGSPPVENTAPDDGAGGQGKTEGNSQSETAVVVVDKTDNVSDSKVIEKNETKVIESQTTIKDKDSNLTTKTLVDEEINKEKNTNDSVVNPTLPSVNTIKSTVPQDKRFNDSESESVNNKETEPKPEPSLDSQINGSTQNEKQNTPSDDNTHPEKLNSSIIIDSNTLTGIQPPSTNSESDPQPDNQENTANSDLNTKPDNQQPTLNLESKTQTENKDFSIDSDSNIQSINNEPSKTDFPVQDSKVPGDKTIPPTSSSFDIKYEDSAATYQQISESEYPSSFNSYDNNGMASSNDIIEEGLNNEDSMPYDNDRGYEKERGTYENHQEKLNGEFTSDEDSHFFAYFLTIMVLAIVFYLLFHNKQRVGQACGCVDKNDRLKRIKQDKAKEPLLKSDTN